MSHAPARKGEARRSGSRAGLKDASSNNAVPPCEPATAPQGAAATARSEAIIAARLAVTGRACGDCSLCCKLLRIVEFAKPSSIWCEHCRPGKGGCSIYATRPPSCRSFACQWLLNEALGDAWQPIKSKIVVRWTATTYTDDDKIRVLQFHVDPGFPTRWREEPYYSHIKQIAASGLSRSYEEMFAVRVIVDHIYFFIMPTRDIEHKQTTPDEEEITLKNDFDTAIAELSACCARKMKRS